jgi:hypothetical protein
VLLSATASCMESAISIATPDFALDNIVFRRTCVFLITGPRFTATMCMMYKSLESKLFTEDFILKPLSTEVVMTDGSRINHLYSAKSSRFKPLVSSSQPYYAIDAPLFRMVLEHHTSINMRSAQMKRAAPSGVHRIHRSTNTVYLLQAYPRIVTVRDGPLCKRSKRSSRCTQVRQVG